MFVHPVVTPILPMLDYSMEKQRNQQLRRLVWPALASLLSVLLAGCGIFDDPGFIVYTVGEPGARDIAVIRPTGEDRRIVIDHPADDYAPVWSPNRQQIAFLSDRDGTTEIYVASADGSNPMRITDNAAEEFNVVWSPDGTRLAYVAQEEGGPPRIYWLRLADRAPVRLEFTSVGETHPAWSSDGRWIAFTALDEMGNPVGIRLRNPDGVNQIRLTDGPDFSPIWAPNGRKLAFVSLRDGQEDIYVINIGSDGSPSGQPRKVTSDPASDYEPRWSPDGRRIAFLSDREGQPNIYIVTERGTDLQAITRNDIPEVSLTWGPGGELVFESLPNGLPSLFLSHDGSQYALAADGLPASQPDW